MKKLRVLLFMVNTIAGIMLSHALLKGPDIKLQGSSATAVLGDSFSFNCSITGVTSLQTPVYFTKPPFTLCWVNDADCTNQSNFAADYTCGCLTGKTGIFYVDIASVSLKDDGNWTCQYNGSSSNTEKLEILYAPTINIPRTMDVTEDTIVTIDCSSHLKPGNPPDVITYEWSGPGYYNETGAVLNRSCTRTEGGLYNCTATNSAGLSDTAAININVQYPPTIYLPSDINVTENSGPPIDCSREMLLGNPTVTSFLWTGPIDYNISGPSLEMNITRSQEGQYTCTANNTIGSDTDHVNINVQYPPTINLAMDILNEIENNTLKIDCSINITSGNPTDISYEWTGREAYSSPEAVLDRNITRNQGGKYICTATNSAGLSDMAQVYVNVYYAPTIYIPYNISIVEDTSPNIDCSSDITPGNPSNTSYVWTGPGGYRSGGSLLERNMTRTQGGQYTCTATNTAGLSDTAHIDVDVLYLDPPMMFITPQQVKENEDAHVICNVQSKPTVKMTIRNVDNTTLVDQELTNSRLYVIDKAQCLQNGTYECTALNEQASLAKTASTPLNVSCAPRHDDRKPLKQLFYRDISETVTIVANVIANPLPTFIWLKYVDGQQEPIANSTVHTVSSTDLQSSLQITVTHVRDYGTYVLKMDNGIEEGSLLYALAPVSAPLPPDEVSVVNVSSTAVTLQWRSNNNGGSEQTFSVDYRAGQGDWNSWKAKIPDPGTGTVMESEIIGLDPNTRYIIQVYAQNLYGTSQKITKDVTTSEKVTARDDKSEDRLGHGMAVGFGTCAPVIVILSCVTVFLYGKRRQKPKECMPTIQAQQTVHVEIRSDTNPACEGVASPPHHAKSNSYVELQECKQLHRQDLDSMEYMIPIQGDTDTNPACEGVASPPHHAKSNSYVELQECKQLHRQDLDSVDYMIPIQGDTESVYDELEHVDPTI